MGLHTDRECCRCGLTTGTIGHGHKQVLAHHQCSWLAHEAAASLPHLSECSESSSSDQSSSICGVGSLTQHHACSSIRPSRTTSLPRQQQLQAACGRFQPPHLHPLDAHALQQLGEDARVRFYRRPVVSHLDCRGKQQRGWQESLAWPAAATGSSRRRQVGAESAGPLADHSMCLEIISSSGSRRVLTGVREEERSPGLLESLPRQ